MIIEEYILRMLIELSPAFWILVGLGFCLMSIKVITRMSDFSTLDKTNVKIKHVPSWVIEENNHRARTLEYYNRIHHHRARIRRSKRV